MPLTEPGPRRRLGCLVAILAALVALTVWTQLRVLHHADRGPLVWRQPEPPIGIPAAILKAAPQAAAAWPGYEPLSQPLLIAVPGFGSYLIGAKSAPNGFISRTTPQGPVLYSARIFIPPFSYVDAFDLDGSTVSALRIDGPPNAFDAARYFLHERFHAQQREKLFKESGDNRYTVEDARDVALAGLENLRLADWVSQREPDAVRDFAALRSRRRTLFPGGKAERWEERIEGTANFVELAGDQATWAPASIDRVLARALIARRRFADMAKWRHYPIGAALCRWLDSEKAPRWRAQVEAGRAPSEVVLARLALGEAEIAARVESLTRRPEYAVAEATARREIAEMKAERERQLAEYNGFPGWRLVLVDSATIANFSGNWIEFPDQSSLLGADEWTHDAPGFRIRLRDKYLLRHKARAEFVLPPETIFIVDGTTWTPKQGSSPFHSLLINAPPRVRLKAEEGRLENDGRHIRLELDRNADGTLPSRKP